MSHVDPDRDWNAALNDLSRSPIAGSAPDFSRSIMGRLGYMRVGKEVARRRRLRLWAGRLCMLAVAGVALAIGWRVFEASPQVRRPVDTTIPQAIRHDVQQQQERWGSMMQTIRSISSPKFVPTSDAGQRLGRPAPNLQPAPGSVDAPFSVEEFSHPENQGLNKAAPQPATTPDGQEMRDDVNRTSRSPVRWV